MRRLGLSFQARIQALVLVSVGLPLVALGTYLLGQHHVVLKEKVHENLSNHLFRTTTRLEDWFQQRLHEVSRWSASFIVFEGIEALERPGADEARADLKEYLDTVLGHYGIYESLFVLDPRGTVVAATREERWEPWEQGILEHVGSEGGAISPIYRSDALGQPTCVVLHGVQGRSQRVLGFLVGRLKLSEIESLLRPSAEQEPDFWLLDREGRVLVRAGHVVDPPGRVAFPAPPPSTGAESGPVTERDLPGLGDLVLGLRRRTGPAPGFVVATVPTEMAYASLRETRRRLLLTGAAVLLAIVLMSTLVARGMLRPVADLARAAQQVKADNYDVSVPVRGRDELADLTRTFNEMAAHIREGRQRLESEKQEFERLSITDDLTGLFNRRHFDDTLEGEMGRCAANGQPLSLLLIDLDHFKQYNDRWGHTEGDVELRRVALQVQSQVRSGSDKGFRYGGEELAVLLPSCSKENAALRAERIRLAVRSPGQRPGAQSGRFTTVSIGVTTFPEDGKLGRGLVDMADAALYTAKRLGRDRVVLAGRPVAEAEEGEVTPLAVAGAANESAAGRAPSAS